MSNLFLEFKDLIFKKHVPDDSLLVPILIWLSGSEKNIEMCQKVNRKFYRGNRKVFIREVSLNNNIKNIIRYPKVNKDDDKLDFFYKDLAMYLNWSSRELKNNLSVIDMEAAKLTIANAYGYDNKQRKTLELETIDYMVKSIKGGKNNGSGTKKDTRQT